MRILLRIARRAWQHAHARFARPRWVVPPSFAQADRVCIIACFAAQGLLAKRVALLADAWRRADFRILFVVAAVEPRGLTVSPAWLKSGDALMVRRNIGYDFGSWSDAIQAMDGVWQPSILALANDSVYGPLANFDSLITRVAASNADIIGLTDSYDYCHHLQSYLVFYKNAAVSSQAFRRFWSRSFCGERGDIIWHAELRLLESLSKGGLDIEVIFPSRVGCTENATLRNWRELVMSGFPFVKVQLLRDNPHGADLEGWDDFLEAGGYDPAVVKADLGDRFAASAAGEASNRYRR